MTWIEALFGMSPDGGDGSLETIIVLTFALAFAAVIAARIRPIRDFIRGRPRF